MAAVAPLFDTLLRHQVYVQRLSSHEVSKFLPFLREMDRSIRDRLADAEVTDMNKARLERLLGAVDEVLATIFTRFGAALQKDLNEYGKYEADFSARALGAAAKDFESVVPTASQIRAAILNTPLGVTGPSRGKLLKPFIQHWTRSERIAVNGVLRRGAFEGKTNAELVREIRGTAGRNYEDGLLNTTRRHADAIVRTAVQHVATVAREETLKQNADIVKAYQWIATLDKRTCFPAGTAVETPSGRVPIESLKAGDLVIGGSREPRLVLETHMRHSNRLVRVRLSNGESVVCTTDHLWLTASGWVEAGMLGVGEKIASKL